ncbi:hypothetical protein F4804DRAFT_343395 [Jackrogersella minutella]|nr:hypothetical protein F4804DRAFT_343395 [Jackrogersella minutella]
MSSLTPCSESGGSEDEEDEERPVKRVKDKFHRILSDLKFCAKSNKVKSGVFNLTDPTSIQAFLNHNSAYIGKKSTKGQTLLHLIAEAEKDELSAARKIKLVKLMCEAHDDVNSILKIPKGLTCLQSANCIHQAILKKSSSKDDDLIKFLIERSDANTLAVDGNGFAPLHLAVEYKRSSDEAQGDIVQALVERCDKVLDTTYKHPEKGLISPYLYHELTHEEAKRKEVDAAEKKQKAEALVAKNERLRNKDNPKNKRGELKEKPRELPVPQVLAPSDFPLRAPRWATPVEASTSKIGSETAALQNISKGPLCATTAVNVIDVDSKWGESTPVVKKSSSKKTRTSSSLGIKQYLKLEYLRKRSHDEAVEFLYGVRQDRQMYFDLFGISPKVSKSRITQGFSHLIFEDILQYVAISRVEIEDDLIGLKPDHRSPKPDGYGRTDMKLLFRWLRDEKKVKTILKIIVGDLQEPAHSDDAIESCLTGMGIEIWDWKEVDLSPEVLQKGWSDSEGLRKLRKLREIHHIQQGLETRAWTQLNVTAFRARFETELIKVQDTKLTGDITDHTTNGVDAVRDPYERQKWIARMQRFADFLQAAERNIDQEPPLTLKHPITYLVQSKLVGGRSFCHRDEEQNLNQSYYLSGSGHGTATALLIAKVCPNVRLYILRPDEYVSEPGKRQITAKSAAKLAACNNILMFCAATDQGAYKDKTYPAATATKSIFKIGAAEASGAALKWIGDQSLVDFIFPGHRVPMERHDDLKDHDRMKEAFSQIGTTKESEYKYIMVWNRFTKYVKNAERASEPKDRYIDYIVKLAGELMREA